MNTKSTRRLLQKAINGAKDKVEQKMPSGNALDHNDILNRLHSQTGQQLNDQDDEEMLRDL